MRTIKESDWKIYRQLHPIVLDRYCRQVFHDISAIISNEEKSPHKRYLDIFQAVKQHDHQIELLLDNPRRSTALMQILAINAQGLFTEEEFSSFSLDIRSLVSRF